MRYRLRLKRTAERSLHALSGRLRIDATEILLDLRENPTPPDSKPLRRELTGRHRIRFDGWRIVYKIDEADQVVLILAIERRTANTYLNL